MDERCDCCSLPVADSLARTGEGDRWYRVCAEQYRILYRAQGLSNHTEVPTLEVLISGLIQAGGR